MGFDLLEYVKKSNYENTALIAPAGYGKTQILLKCFEALKSENGVVPCYIDAAALNTKDLYTELQKYFFNDEKSYLGSIEFFKRFYNMVSAQSDIKYVLLINHYEDSFNNESIADVTNIIENFVKMGCCVIVSSAFNDGKVFENFKVLKLEPHSKEKIISILDDKFKDSPKFDFKNLKEQVYSIISTPLMLGWYIELIKTNSANDVMINSEHQLMDRRFNEVLDNDFVLKTAYYCAEHKTKYIAEKELAELLLAHNGKVRLVSRIFGKKHINDFEADVLMLEKYGIAKYVKNNQKLVFSNQIYVDYFAAKKIGRDVNNNNFDVFDELIFSEQICKFLSYEIDKISLLTELDSLRANQRGNVDRCFESCDDIVKTTNLVNILYFYKNSFRDCDLHSLDLRLCNFIGKECVNTDFSNSLCNDACFVPLESETPNFFAISENGKYFATGDDNAVNIWDAKYSTVIHRVLSDESSPVTDIGYKKDTGFVISANSELYSSVIVKIKNGIISQSLNYDKNIAPSCIEKSKKDSADKFDSYGTLCCKQENFVLLRSDENSYYGNAYLLFDVENEKLLSVCKANRHLEISNAVQDGDEIEFLIKSDGKPLRSICFNDSTKEIYRKNYSSLIGRCCSYKNGTTVLFDTENVENYIKWWAYSTGTGKYTNQKITVSLKSAKCFVDSAFEKNHRSIDSANKNFVIEFQNKNYRFYGNNLIYNNAMHGGDSFSYDDCYLWKFIGSKYIIREIHSDRSIVIYKKDYCKNIANSFSCNLVNVGNKIFIFLGNRICEVVFDGNEGELNFLKKIELVFTSEYLYTIENFPWSEVIKNVFDKQNEIPNCDLVALSEKVTAEKLNLIIGKMKNNLCEFNSEHWSFAFADYIENTIKDNISTEDDILCNEEYIDGFKNWCFPCDSGISYYNGKESCYIHLNENFNVEYKNEYVKGCILLCYRNQIHYHLLYEQYNYTQNIKLWDIYKSKEKNEVEKPIIPIYDLNLYQSNIADVLGISAGVKDILKKQTEIYTKYLTFDD
ncbi:MAG: hypothetical protein PUE48_00820 [Eubacterium coprostanoligenes]|uniref:hypothetical protein n=1 Tax=Eubacterium coprostanoligenes TaxID=290054 RepID=UPI00240A6375|nr:hypothetical protein [Eubacterium coprostanoligenes]MDD6664874.1 hypothetical protein [Eubacterium coprostanoligenes]